MNKADFKLDDSVSSLQDLKALSLEIREYARWFAHNAIKKQVHAKSGKSSGQPALSPAAETVIHGWGAAHPIDQKSLDALIATLDDYEKNAPSFTIILAAPPSGGLKKTLVAWCRQNVSPNVLVSFQFNSTILGGMVIRSGSRVFDWSFRRQILASRDKFPETLRRV